MHGLAKYVSDNFTLDDIEKFQSILEQVRETKKTETDKSVSLDRYNQEYSEYIKKNIMQV